MGEKVPQLSPQIFRRFSNPAQNLQPKHLGIRTCCAARIAGTEQDENLRKSCLGQSSLKAKVDRAKVCVRLADNW